MWRSLDWRMADSQLVTSRSIPPVEDEIGLLDVAVIMAESLRLLIFGPLAIGLVAFAISSQIAPTFTARTSFLPPQQQQSAASAMLSQLGALSGLATSVAGMKSPSDQYVALTKSVVVADKLVAQFNLVALYDVKYREDARKKLGDHTKVTAGKDGLLVIEVDDESPKRAADIANAYVAGLKELLGTLSLTEAQNRRAFFERQLEQTKIKLTAAELALNSIGVSADAIKADPKAAVEMIARLGAQVTAQEVKLASMRGYLSETAPEFRQAQLALNVLRMQLQKSETGGQGKETASRGGYIEKYRDFKYQEALFELFARQFELAKVDEAREGAILQLVDIALPPERKSKPAKALISIAAMLMAEILLLMWVFLRQFLSNMKSNAEHAGKLALIHASLRRMQVRRLD